MEIISATLLAEALFEAGKKLTDVGIINPALEKGLAPLSEWITSGYDNKKAEQVLRKLFQKVIAKLEKEHEFDDLSGLWIRTILIRLQAPQNDALRRHVANAVLAFTNPNSKPPNDLIIALRWPRGQEDDLAFLLYSLRESLAVTKEWGPLIISANAAAELEIGRNILRQISEWNNLMVLTDAGKALRVHFEKQGITQSEIADIERRYREDLIYEFYWHNFRGITDVTPVLRMPLQDIYLELGLLPISNKEDQIRRQEQLLQLDPESRSQIEEKRIEQRIGEGLAQAKRLVILGNPGTGKTISLRFIALMLAYGSGASGLGWDQPYIPLFLRLADYAREIETQPSLSLDNYLIKYIQQAYSVGDRSGEFLREALEQGHCAILLDGLDEVEVATEIHAAKKQHPKVVDAVQKLGDVRCNGERGNLLIVTSRVEGYWNNPLRGFLHAEISPLRMPDEIEAFLLQWYIAYEKSHDKELPYATAEERAKKKVGDLMPRILSVASISQLAKNPLLLTILALINEKDGHLPNRRIKLYEVAAKTLIKSWRQDQAGLPSELLDAVNEEKLIYILARLAYWLQESMLGGTASLDELQKQLSIILGQEEFTEDAGNFTNRFLYHARFYNGLLVERGLGQFGFFHTTFQEYFAARQIARQSEKERRRILKEHWTDPHWQEVILLTAGQLGIIENGIDDASVFIEALLKMEPKNSEHFGRSALMAGRALADMGAQSVSHETHRWVKKALICASQNLDPDTNYPTSEFKIPPVIRAATADVLDEMGYLPENLYDLVDINGVYIAKYPITNAQYELFLTSNDFFDPDLWDSIHKLNEVEEQKINSSDFSRLKRLEKLRHIQNETSREVIYPEYWKEVRFGIARRGVPVVGITMYEADAYCKWLQKHWSDPEVRYMNANPGLKPLLIRMPTELEWVRAAGGESGKRFAWGELNNEKEIVYHCNTLESDIKHTTQVWMYPQGAGPNGIMDLCGNTWEWQVSPNKSVFNQAVLRGGSWNTIHRTARIESRTNDLAGASNYAYGFRIVVVPVPE